MTPPTSYEIDRFCRLLTQHLGWHIEDGKADSLAVTLAGRASALHLGCAAYLDHLNAAPSAELPLLARELTITETYFMRYGDQFVAFTDVALPACLQSARGSAVQVLSMGCASGEESYSLAIAVRERMPEAAAQLVITAADINPAMIERARRARYSSWSLRDCTPELKARWFSVEGQHYALNEEIARAVRFEALNLAHDDAAFWSPGRFDIIFCRNLLMYFTPEQAQAAVARIATALAPNGFLFLGHAESLRGLSNEFHVCHHGEAFYYRRDASRSAMVQPARPDPPPVRMAPIRAATDTSWVDTIRQATERIATLQPPRSPADVAIAVLERPGPNLAPIHALLQQERYEQVITQLDLLADEHESDSDVLLLRGVALCHAGEVGKAEVVCRRLLAIDELNAGAHYLLALCRESAGDLDAAREHDQIASHLDPQFAMPRLHLGLIAKRQRDYDMAAQELARAETLLQREDAARILMFGGGFKRETLIALCKTSSPAKGERG
jgi:chemotaxis protein methyltransferase CheR